MVGRFLAGSTWAVRLLTVLVLVLAVIAVVGPEIREPWRIVDFERQNQPPTTSYPLGTDSLGRDNASRIADGLRSSIIFGVAAAAFWAGLCVAVGLVGRQLRRVSGSAPANLLIDVAVAVASLVIATALTLDLLDPDAGWFREPSATSSPGHERLTLTLWLYESSLLLFIGMGIALAIWVSRTSVPATRRVRWTLIGVLALAALAVRAEPFLAYLGASPVEVPSGTIGALIDERARYASTEWWTRVPLALLWVATMIALLGSAVWLAARCLTLPSGWARRVPVYLVALAWAIALTGIVWRLTVRPVEEWAYWVSTALAGVGLLWCAAVLRRNWREPAGRGVYIAAIACAVPLALDWPLAKALDFAIPRLF